MTPENSHLHNDDIATPNKHEAALREERLRLYGEAVSLAMTNERHIVVATPLDEAEVRQIVAEAYELHDHPVPVIEYTKEGVESPKGFEDLVKKLDVTKERNKVLLKRLAIAAGVTSLAGVIGLSGYILAPSKQSPVPEQTNTPLTADEYETYACSTLPVANNATNGTIMITDSQTSPVAIHGTNVEVLVTEGVVVPEVYLCGSNTELTIEGVVGTAGVFGTNASLTLNEQVGIAVASGTNMEILNSTRAESVIVAGVNADAQ